jgi:2-polyprenyl-6-methoxyphenol hydroxylase-like FAD-dependent oxidoreductase
MRNEQSPEETDKNTLAVIKDQLASWPALVQNALQHTDASKLIPFSIHARPAPKAMGKGRVIAIGDASHAMEPNLGQGACQSIEDAYALGIAASHYDVDELAAAFQRVRLKRARKFVKSSALIGAAAKYESALPCAVRSLVMKMTPDALTKAQMTQNNILPDYAARLGISA